MTNDRNSADEFERVLAEGHSAKYLLRLYVAGMTPRSTEVLARIKALCEEHLPGRYELEVIDIYQQPHLAGENQIVVTPTLVKVLPEPLRRLVGDLLATDRVLHGLNIQRRD